MPWGRPSSAVPGQVDRRFLLPGACEARCARKSGRLYAFESGDDEALETALSALGGPRFGLDSLPADERRRAVLDLLPPAGATGAALRTWGDALAAFESDPSKAHELSGALHTAISAGIPRQSLPEVPWLRARARELTEGFSRSGGHGPLQPLLVLLELLGAGLKLDLGEFESAALEGLRAGGGAASSPEGGRPAPDGELRSGGGAAGEEKARLSALLGISPAVSMRSPSKGSLKPGGNG